MTFEDYYDNFFNNRRALEDPYNRVTISKEKYNNLLEIAGKYEALVKEYRDIVAKKTEIQKQLEDLKDDGRNLKELEEKAENYYSSLLRTKADFENYKKASNRENERYRQRYQEKMLVKLIKHYEDLIRALKVLETIKVDDSVQKGFKIITENFAKLLEEEGITLMKVEGEIFDPYKHEVVLVEENDELPENTIIEELDKGYYLNNKILKPARVKISKLKSKS